MCGITGYIGNRGAYSVVVKGLQRLEYRGYDSAGIMLFDEEVQVHKTKGKVVDLQAIISEENNKGNIGIGHTRWATHGVPNDVNSHPHTSNSGNLTIVHNGIIENYDAIKEELVKRGYVFHSDTDTEVLVNLIEEVQKQKQCKLAKAVQLALNDVIGAYAIAVFDKKSPEEMVVAKLGSPLAIGIGENNLEFFVASDASPFIEYTKNAIYLEDQELAVVKAGCEIEVRKVKDGSEVNPLVHALDMDLSQIEKEGFDHFMLKDIYEQPKAITDTYRGRLLANEGIVRMAGIEEYIEKFKSADRIIIIACGTSWHAGLVAEYIFEEITRVPVEVEYASEFRYRNPIITEKDVIIAISQSGETADSLAAIKMAKEKGALIFGVCNVVGSSISRESHAGAYTHAGPEIGVASTKAFTTQITLLTLMALKLAKEKGSISNSNFHAYLQSMELIPSKVEKILEQNEKIKSIAADFLETPSCLYLGRGYNFPVALEGALKLKEISYIHAEGYPAAEMKHGPIALIEENYPVIVVAINKGHYEKVVSNIQEIKSRKGKIIAVVTEGDVTVKEMADCVIEIPEVEEALSPLLTTIPLQLLSYHIAVARGCNVDQPRNLAKSVTVE
jgi:glucosamine--fructose-6-phosphate aminotransferase (isomerizing)